MQKFREMIAQKWEALKAKLAPRATEAQAKVLGIFEKAKSFRGSLRPKVKDAYLRSKESLAAFVRADLSRKHVAVILVLGMLLGAGLKVLAADTFTIGYEDYKAPKAETLYNLNDLQEELLENGGSLAVSEKPSGEVCTE